MHDFERNETKDAIHRITAGSLAALGAAAIALSSFALAACGTVEGAGEDIEYAGSQINDEAEDMQDD